MKYLNTLIIAMLIAANSFAGNQLFERQKKYQKQLSKSLKSQKSFNLLSTLENIPGLTKTSNWDEFNSLWMNTEAQIQIAENNKIVRSYYTSYNLVDTFSRISYTYDNQGRYSSSLTENKENNGLYTPSVRVNFSYSTDGLTQTVIIEQYDYLSNTWKNDSKILMVKNDRGEDIRMIYYYFNNNAWEVSFGYSTKITYLNSNSPKTTEVIDSTFDFNTKTMKALYKVTQAYDANERAVDIRFYDEDFTTGSLVYVSQDSVYYNNNGLPIVVIEKEIDGAGNATDLIKYTDITWQNYNSNINLFDNYPSSYFVYLKLGNSWLLAGRSTTTYPDNYGSRISLQEVYESGSYVPEQRSTELYNSNFDLIEDKYESFNVDSNFWIVNNGYKYLITYDANNNQIEYISQNYNFNSRQFVNTEKKEYSNFILVNTSTNDIRKNELSIYPNPVTTNELKISHENISNENVNIYIYDISAKLIKEYKLNIDGTNTKIELDDLEKGIYILRMETKNINMHSKFIKE